MKYKNQEDYIKEIAEKINNGISSFRNGYRST